jgi:FG-GAP-like repeat
LANAFCSSLPSDFSLYVSQRGLLTVSELLFIGAWLLRLCGSRNIFYFPVKADFNGDGKSDILWQNSVNGQRVIWVMNGTSYSSYVDLGIVATSWRIVGSADFNADRDPDILWENSLLASMSSGS